MPLSDPPALQPLQRLHHLDRVSSDFHDQLHVVLSEERYAECEQRLDDDDLMWLLKYLDEALDYLDYSSPAYQKCQHELRSICGARAKLPTSYTILPHLLGIDSFPLPSGPYGDVYEGSLDSSKVCVKRVRVYAQDRLHKAVQTICKGAAVWKRLKHQNVVPLLGITITPIQLISDWMPGGDLPKYIEKHPDVDRLGLLTDVGRGLCYLHSRDVIHGNLKGSNVLVDAAGRARITDFCLAAATTDVDPELSTLLLHNHTVQWTAPEILNGGKYSKETDIFSLAMVMIEIFTCEVPFNGFSPQSAMLAIIQGGRPPRPAHPEFTENLWKLTQNCWHLGPHLRPTASGVLQTLLILDLPAWKRLISYPLSTGGRITLITSIFSDRSEVEAVGHLSGGDAQTFIDTIDEVLDILKPEIRKRCLHCLLTICGRQCLLPKSFPVLLSGNLLEAPQYAGEFTGVRKSRYHEQEIAVKALRVSTSDMERTRERFCKQVVIWKSLHHPNVLPLLGVVMTENRFAMASEWMTNGNINQFVKGRPDANRLELLAEVAKGLSYLHDQGIVHGNLNGSNILIDSNGRACLAGFDLFAIIPDERPTTPPDTPRWVGNVPWSAPEVLNGGVPSNGADIFSLAMVAIEIFTGVVPFGDYTSSMAISSIIRGQRPPRPAHPDVTGRLWKLVQQCWDQCPDSRPEASEVRRILLDSNPPAWKRLISPTISTEERIDLITSIFSDCDEVEVFEYLSGKDAQAFVDVIDEVLDSSDSFPREIRRNCLRSSYRTRGREGILPKSLSIQFHYNPREAPECSGRLVDMWKGEYDGQAVAVKAPRVHLMGDIEGIRKRFCEEVVTWKTLRHPNVLPLLGVAMTEDPCRLVMVSKWMEVGNINTFVKAHPDVNRLKLLADVSRGLVYMHDRGIVHGDLKGANIMIDNDGRALLTDSALTALIPAQSTFISTCLEDDTIRWISPEILKQKGWPTMESDCYALGMVIYEVLSGGPPFGTSKRSFILREVMGGKHPERPQGEGGNLFTDAIWDMVKLCWKAVPSERASARDVLLCLGEGSTMDGASADCVGWRLNGRWISVLVVLAAWVVLKAVTGQTHVLLQFKR